MRIKKKVLISFFIILSILVPLASISAYPKETKQTVTLTAITRHDGTIYEEFESEFKAAHPELDVEITWLELTTNAAWAKAIQSTTHTIDFCWGGGPTVFSIVANYGLLAPMDDPDLIDMIDNEIPAEVAGVSMNLKDENEDYLWVAAALSSFGYTINHANLEKYGLEMPETWQDLADPEWFLGRTQFAEAMGDAPLTTSNTRCYQIITQAFGWEMGWQLMTMIGGNSKMTGESGPTRDSVITGPQAAAMTIDFYGYQAMNENPECEYVIPTGQSIINGDPIAMASSCDDPEVTQEFIKFVLSKEAQAIWLDRRFNRLPIRADAFDYSSEQGNARPDLENAYNNAINNIGIPFDEDEAVNNYDAFTYYFRATITDAHNELVETWAQIVDLYLNGGGNLSTAEFRSVVRTMGQPSITAEECKTVQAEYLASPASIEPYIASWKAAAKARYKSASEKAIAESNDNNDNGEYFNPYSADISGVTSGQVLTTDINVSIIPQDYANYTYLYGTKDIKFILDGEESLTDEEAPFECLVELTGLADGPHSVLTIATEHMGTTYIDWVNFHVNSEIIPPTYTITPPTGVVGNVTAITGTIPSGTGFTPSEVQLFIISASTGKIIWTATQASSLNSFSVPVNTTELPNGEHSVLAIIIYEEGNSIIVDASIEIYNEPLTTSAPFKPSPGFFLLPVIPIFMLLVIFNKRKKK
ncbi:MAG: ABC transporter substrate-binding protein [Candidatus Heimdallarchaeota archaeon]|nr:ABC transporter substrate-binding protein [Candidatus Heimdallarchaeota archaeon]